MNREGDKVKFYFYFHNALKSPQSIMPYKVALADFVRAVVTAQN